MMDEFVHWPLAKTCIFLFTTCDEILSWMIENWMKHHLVCDNNCNIVNYNTRKHLQGIKNNVGSMFIVGDTIP